MAKYSDGLDAVTTALAHPGRRQIIDRLGRGPATSSELAGLLDIGLPALTKHSRLLTTAGLTRTEKRGRVVHHHLEPSGLAPLSVWVEQRRAFWNSQLDHLTDHLEQS